MMLSYIFNKLIPSQILTNHYLATIAKNIIGTLFVGIIICPVFALVYFYLNFYTATYFILLLACVFCLDLILFQYLKSIFIVREIILVGSAVVLTWLMIALEGLNDPAAFWLLILPLLAIFLGSVMSGIIWGVIVSVILVITHYLMYAHVYIPHSPIKNPLNLQIASLIGLNFVMISIAYLFERGKKESLEQLQYLAFNDPLTGLKNRAYFEKEFQNIIVNTNVKKEKLILLHIDIDNFKTINDTLGHDIGDLLLLEMVKRFKAYLLKDAKLARVGGDEFFILIKVAINYDVTDYVKNLLELSKAPYFLENQEVVSGISLGIASYPKDGVSAKTLARSADIALSEAKIIGKNTFRFFLPHLGKIENRKLLIRYELPLAIKKSEFSLNFQPQFYAKNVNKIEGIEILIRWNNPTLGSVDSADFIPIAENIGLIRMIDMWVLDEACRQLNLWNKDGLVGEDIKICINISAPQLQNLNLVKNLSDCFKKYEINTNNVEIEITETSLISNQDSAIAMLNEIKKLGVSLAIDDFGTGYSSLSYLTKLPIYILKIDQSFIKILTDKSENAIIVKTIIDLAHDLKLKVIAEGVETIEQLKILQNLDCDFVQGYYLSHPLNLEDIEVLLRKSI
ncbi:MAG: EAL domain-containing protein [Gammaproteobacteria bacterium]|nr:EAL domain-containing protein [Gammaproteobacteria bacterium]